MPINILFWQVVTAPTGAGDRGARQDPVALCKEADWAEGGPHWDGLVDEPKAVDDEAAAPWGDVVGASQVGAEAGAGVGGE